MNIYKLGLGTESECMSYWNIQMDKIKTFKFQNKGRRETKVMSLYLKIHSVIEWWKSQKGLLEKFKTSFHLKLQPSNITPPVYKIHTEERRSTVHTIYITRTLNYHLLA